MARVLILPLCFAWLALGAHCQQLASGSLLVATDQSHDADFAHSVVLLIRFDPQSAVGLILNKLTDVPLSQVLPEARGKSTIVYAGGPLMIGVRGLVRSPSPPYFTVITKMPRLLRLISDGTQPSSFRIYAGYVGWTTPQLQSEVARGLWKVLPANPNAAFDPHPETLWARLTASRPIR